MKLFIINNIMNKHACVQHNSNFQYVKTNFTQTKKYIYLSLAASCSFVILLDIVTARGVNSLLL